MPKEIIVLKSTPRDILLHLLNIAAFYVSAVSYSALLVQYINVLLPDPLQYHDGDAVFWSTSILVVAFPCYLFTSWLLERDFAREQEKRELKVRKWLLYATLFIAAVTFLGDLVALVFNFLRGELTMRFFLKVVVVMAVSSSVFGYYFWELKRKGAIAKKGMRPQILALAVSTIILASIIAGFVLVGTPGVQRARRLDERRVGDLSNMQYQIIDYWIRKGALPQTTNNLRDALSDYTPPVDPDTGRSYEYRKTGDLSFELCAEFQADSKKITRGGSYVLRVEYPYVGGKGMGNWEHDAGRTCFTRTIDPNDYNTYPRPIEIPEKPPMVR